MTLAGSTEAIGSRRGHWPGRLLDGAFVLLLLGLWIIHVGPISFRERAHSYDVCRDVASAVNIQQGRWWGDPALRDQTIWYPPLSPLLAAAVSHVVGQPPMDVYVVSQTLLNWLIPAGMFVVVRLAWGRWAAVGATLALLLAMPWWQTRVAAAQPSWHAVIGGWLTLLLYGQAERRASPRWAAACGFLTGISFLHHPIVPAILVLAFVVRAVWERLGRPRAPEAVAAAAGLGRRTLVVVGLALLIGGPATVIYGHGPERNPEPRECLMDELRTVEFPLLNGNWWLWGVGLLGCVAVARGRSWPGRLLLSVLVVCLAGQLPGYARIYGPSWAARVPIVVPHQFQMHFQLGWAVCVGVGIRTLTSIARFLKVRWLRRATAFVVGLVGLAATAYPGIRYVEPNLRRTLMTDELPADFASAAQWIRTHTDINDVFACDPHLAYLWLGPATGRKAWIVVKGHSNPRVDWNERQRVYDQLRLERSPSNFRRIAREHGIDYCIPGMGWVPRILTDRTLAPGAAARALSPAFNGPGGFVIFRVEDTEGGSGSEGGQGR